MSGFLLWWHKGGARLTERELAGATQRLEVRGPEGVARRDVPGVHAIHTAFEDAIGAEDDLPLAHGGWLIAADLRLDDQPALRARLRDASCEPPPRCTDARLLGAALEAWGSDAARHLIGDYAFAAVDAKARRFVAARGTVGVKSLFVAETKELIACSNDAEVLAALEGVDGSVDEVTVGQFLASGVPWSTGRSFRRGVGRLPAGHQWTWDEERGASLRRAWTFPVPSPCLLRRDEAIVEAFHEVLGAAVADRLRVPRATVLLSGGLDSPSLAATAMRVRPGVQLEAVTMSTDPVVPDEESPWARSVAMRLGLPHEVVRRDADTVLEHCDDAAFRSAEPIDEPEFATWRAKFARLAARGPVTIYGEDADSLLAPPTLLGQLRAQSLAETVRAWRAYRAETGARAWIGARESLRPRPSRRAAPHAVPEWLLTDVRGGTGPDDLGVAAIHPTRMRAVDRLDAPIWETMFAALDPAGTGVAHTVLLPFLDPRVIAFVFSLPPVPWCQRKHLLRRAFAGRLPDAVLARPKAAVRGYPEGLVARWRARGGAERMVSDRIAPYVAMDRWRAVLRASSETDAVMAAWRVFELDRWLAQSAGA